MNKKKKKHRRFITRCGKKKKEGRKDEKEETISFQIKQFIKYHAYEFSRNMQRLTHTIHAPFFFFFSLSSFLKESVVCEVQNQLPMTTYHAVNASPFTNQGTTLEHLPFTPSSVASDENSE